MKSNYCAYVDKGLRLSFMSMNGKAGVRTTPCCHLLSKNIPGVEKFIKVESTDSIVNHPMRQYFKDYFMNNADLHPFCAACKHKESNGVSSERQKYNNLEKRISEENFAYDFLKLDVIIGNTCNLACPFCSQASSSLIDTISSNFNKKDLPYHWKNDTESAKSDPKVVGETCAELLKKYKIYSFKIVGGEPFLKENWEPIGQVLDCDYGRELHLEVTTNGSILNRNVLERISKTKTAFLRISVDSIGNNYNFIRWPHKWKKMQNNLFYLRDNLPNNVDYKISVLVNVFNFEILPDIEDFFTKNNLKFSLDFTLKPFESPLQWFNMPVEIKHKVYTKIKDKEAKYLIYADWDQCNLSDLQTIKNNAEFYLEQRNMKSQNVLGPLTREWLCMNG